MMRERIPLLSNELLRSPSQFIIFGLNKYLSQLLKCWFAFVFITTSFTFTLAAGTAFSIAQWQSAGFECGRSRVQSPVKDRLLDSLVVQCWLRVREVPGSIPSQGPSPRQPSGRVLASSAGGSGFNPQSRIASSIAQWYSAGFECGRSRVQYPVKDRVIPKTL